MATRLLLTCEHAGHDVPARYRDLFVGHEEVLLTHKGWDPGALRLAREMAKALDAPLFFATTTRLLIDLNRSIGNPELHGEQTRRLPLVTRRAIVATHYRPHRDAVEQAVADTIAAGDHVLHVASHSFTPELNGVLRTADIGFLYDPSRPGEVGFAKAWLEAVRELWPELRARRNYPYLGIGDGLTLALRRRHPADRYIGIELEVNQRFVEEGGPAWPRVRRALVDSLGAARPAAFRNLARA